MAPDDVQNRDENRLWVRLYRDCDTYLKDSTFQEAMVRVSGKKTIFDKRYMHNWTNEHFTERQAVPYIRGAKSCVYKLLDYNDEDVKSSWYPVKIQEI